MFFFSFPFFAVRGHSNTPCNRSGLAEFHFTPPGRCWQSLSDWICKCSQQVLAGLRVHVCFCLLTAYQKCQVKPC